MVFISLIVVTSCSHGKAQTLEAFYTDAKINQIDKVIIQNGTTGASKTIVHADQIDELMSSIKHIELTPHSNQEDRTGWSYRIILFDDEKKFDFYVNKIGNTYYESNPDMGPIVDVFYRNLEIEEER